MASALPHFDKFPVHEEEHTAGTRFKRWIALFNNLMTAMDLDDNPKRKKALLLHYAGEEVFDIYDSFTVAEPYRGLERRYDWLPTKILSDKWPLSRENTRV